VERAVEVVVTNDSARAWHPVGSGGFEVAVGSRWRRADGSLLGEGLRTSLPAILPPGESALVSADVIPPAEPGAYVVELDLVQEHVRWFGVPATLEVTVVPYRRVGIVALDADLALDVAARLTAQRPEQGLVVLVPGDEEIRAPYPVEKLDVRRHVGELDRLYVAGSPEQARKRVRASLLEARLLARRRGVEIVVLRRAEDL
jgi:hypothetical protein